MQGQVIGLTEQECKMYEAMAKLALPDEERDWLIRQAEMLEERFAALDALELDGVLPLVTVSELKNVFRDDAARKFIPREELLSGAPEQYDGYFQVPKTVE